MEKELQFKLEEEWEEEQERAVVTDYDRIRNQSPSSLKRFKKTEARWMLSQAEHGTHSAQLGRSDSPCARSHSPTIFFPLTMPAQLIAEKLSNLQRSQSSGALCRAAQSNASLAARTSLSESNTPLSSSPADQDITVSESKPFHSPRYKPMRSKGHNKPSPLSKS